MFVSKSCTRWANIDLQLFTTFEQPGLRKYFEFPNIELTAGMACLAASHVPFEVVALIAVKFVFSCEWGSMPVWLSAYSNYVYKAPSHLYAPYELITPFSPPTDLSTQSTQCNQNRYTNTTKQLDYIHSLTSSFPCSSNTSSPRLPKTHCWPEPPSKEDQRSPTPQSGTLLATTGNK